jgi:predicted nucleic acid-binding Zn ribbon protein
MPEYVYRREDGSTFTVRQSFNDAPLTADPETGQKVIRVIQNAGVIFKGSGFYITDNKNGSAARRDNGNGSRRDGDSSSSDNGSNGASAEKSAPASTAADKSPKKDTSLAAAGD